MSVPLCLKELISKVVKSDKTQPVDEFAKQSRDAYRIKGMNLVVLSDASETIEKKAS